MWVYFWILLVPMSINIYLNSFFKEKIKRVLNCSFNLFYCCQRKSLILYAFAVISDSMQSTVIDILLDIKIASIRQQGLEKVLHTKHLPATFLQATLSAVSQQLATQGTYVEGTGFTTETSKTIKRKMIKCVIII